MMIGGGRLGSFVFKSEKGGVEDKRRAVLDRTLRYVSRLLETTLVPKRMTDFTGFTDVH